MIGSLLFVCKAVPSGRAFLRRIINLTLKLKCPSHRVRITVDMVEARKDFLIWKEFLAKCNGSAIIPEQVWQDNADIQLFTDASGSKEFGGYFQGSWLGGGGPIMSVSFPHPSLGWNFFLLLRQCQCGARSWRVRRSFFDLIIRVS